MTGTAWGITGIPKRPYGLSGANSGILHAPPALSQQALHPQGCLAPPHAAHQGSPNIPTLGFILWKHHLDGIQHSHCIALGTLNLEVWCLRPTGPPHGPREDYSTIDMLYVARLCRFSSAPVLFSNIDVTKERNISTSWLTLEHWKTLKDLVFSIWRRRQRMTEARKTV